MSAQVYAYVAYFCAGIRDIWGRGCSVFLFLGSFFGWWRVLAGCRPSALSIASHASLCAQYVCVCTDIICHTHTHMHALHVCMDRRVHGCETPFVCICVIYDKSAEKCSTFDGEFNGEFNFFTALGQWLRMMCVCVLQCGEGRGRGGIRCSLLHLFHLLTGIMAVIATPPPYSPSSPPPDHLMHSPAKHGRDIVRVFAHGFLASHSFACTAAATAATAPSPQSHWII